MNQFTSSVQSLFDVLASAIKAHSSKGNSGDARISEGADGTPLDLIWWSWSLSIDPACRVLAGASWAAWKEICGLDDEATPSSLSAAALVALTGAIQEAAEGKFGSEVTCGAAERSEEPPREWTSASYAIEPTPGASMPVYFNISPDLEAALGGPAPTVEGSVKRDFAPRFAAAGNSADILMHVELPVTIILGCTTMRLKDLLNLTNGSVVELDQMLDEEVEVRINNCVIAYGEVVSVDGNYAVRILRMAPPQQGDLRRELPEKAA